jgi:hypothetical protein
MTTSSALNYINGVPAIRSARATGLSRLVMRVSMSMFVWAARRAAQLERGADAQHLIVAEARARESREHNARLMHYRVG